MSTIKAIELSVAALLSRLLDLPMPAGLIKDLKQFAELTKEPQLKEIHETSWTLVGLGMDPSKRGVGWVLTEAGEEGPENCGDEEGKYGVGRQYGGKGAGRDENGGAECQGERQTTDEH